MTVQEGSLKKMICEPFILEIDKSSKHSQHTVHFFPCIFPYMHEEG